MAVQNKNKKYLCFADFEFTCGVSVPNWRRETLSVGIIICDTDYRFVDCYYSTCRPASKCRLTKECRKLTHLKQEEIDRSPDSNRVFGEVCEMLEKYDIRDVKVWGNDDRIALYSDFKMHKKNKADGQNIRRVELRIHDIQNKLTLKMELPQAVNIEELATAFGYTPAVGTFHNAYNDAMALYLIQKAVFTTDFQNNLKFAELKQKRLDRIAAEKKRVDETRKANALSVPLSAREQEYYSQISESGTEKDIKNFIFLRSKIISALNHSSEEERFFLIVYPAKIKIIPQSRFDPEKNFHILRITDFCRNDFGDVVVDECKLREK